MSETGHLRYYRSVFEKALGSEENGPALAMFVSDIHGNVKWCSPAFREIIGLDPSEIPGWSLLRMLLPESLPTALHHIRRSVSGERHGFVLHCVGSTGRFDALVLTFPLRTFDGLEGFGGFVSAASADPESECQGELLFQRAVEGMKNPVAFLDEGDRLLWGNRVYFDLVEKPIDWTLGSPAPHLRGQGNLSRIARECCEREEEWQGEIRIEDQYGGSPWLLHVSKIRPSASDRPLYIHSLTDIGPWHERHEHLEYLALHDHLTGLPNRTRFREELENCLYRSKRDGHEITVMFIDLDRFKRVNDHAGHAVGDKVLRQIGQVFERIARRHRFLIARLGGDEFGACFSGVNSLTRAREAAAAMIRGLKEGVEAKCDFGPFTASIGLATGMQAVETLLSEADRAMYEAKNLGGNRIRLAIEREGVEERGAR